MHHHQLVVAGRMPLLDSFFLCRFWISNTSGPEEKFESHFGSLLAERVDGTVAPQPDGVEFAAWAWTDIDELIQQVAPFRRPSYKEMLRGRR